MIRERSAYLLLANLERLHKLQAGPLESDPPPDSAATLNRRLALAERDALDFAIACGAEDRRR
jgi:hypothetical protein